MRFTTSQPAGRSGAVSARSPDRLAKSRCAGRKPGSTPPWAARIPGLPAGKRTRKCVAVGSVGRAYLSGTWSDWPDPGHPPSWDELRGEYGPPAGDLVDISCEWNLNGRHHSVTASTFLREIEYARLLIPRPWVFAGSLRLRDGSLAADRSGVGIALVDFPDSLLSLSRRFPSRYGELWAEANTPAIPPIGTSVRLILRPAQPRAYRVNLDFRGQLFVDERFIRPADLVDLLKLARQLEPDYVQVINTQATLRSDLVRLQQMLVRLGLPSKAVRINVAESDNPP